MRPRRWYWFLVVLLLMVGAAFWWGGGGWRAGQGREARSGEGTLGVGRGFVRGVTNGPGSHLNLRSLFAVVATNPPNAVSTNPWAYRLSNTKEPFGELVRNEHAVLLRNALIDTALGSGPSIPEHLKAKGDPGSYIVQAGGAITAAFRDELRKAGAEIVSYVPNNSFLVLASKEAAQKIRSTPGTQAVLPYEAYYKLDALLLPLAVRQDPSPYEQLNVVAFPGRTAQARAQLERLGARVTRPPEATTFGDILTAKIPADALAAVAQINEVHMLGVHFEKKLLNDLSRVKLRVSTNTIAPPPQSHYAPRDKNGTPRNLTGEGIVVAVADTGVDPGHPDLTGRVFGPNAVSDYDGHGTHVIGSLLGDGSRSSSVGGDGTNSFARGSTNGAYFTGMAPRAKAYVQDLIGPDAELQQNAARTNALISNNSWGYPLNDYDIFAASYDAAVRDSLPGVTGEQEVAYVFAAGNDGGGGPNGLNGIAGSILSPATAKNVISVGAVDQARFISNVVTRGCDTNGVCQTNRPWLGMTDSDNQVTPFSARGNVGIGIEGPVGRIKPDVVAPGAMTVSTRSGQYEDPDGSTNTVSFQYNSVAIGFNATNLYALNLPAEAIRVEILTLTNSFSPTNMTLLIGADVDNIPASALATNDLVLDLTTVPRVRQGTLYYTVANPFHSNTVVFDLVVLLTFTNDVGDYYTVLKGLNAPLKPYYRYESGTSMAAPKISGMLALIQEYLGTNFSLRPSPALLKALLINGARSLSQNYNLDSHASLNHQGWGIASISNSIPSNGGSPTNGPLRFYDQSVTNGLATGGTHYYEVTVPPQARSYPLRISAVWTDPPGNPIASVKLVNDLNILATASATNVIAGVTNSASFVWVGNNFPPGSDFTTPLIASSTDPDAEISTNLVQDIENARDLVNNVENIYIAPPLADKYTILVQAHRVNVNALNSDSNSIAQDYALVISSGNVGATNVDLAVTGPVFTNDPSPRLAALIRATNATTAGLMNQRVGANAPLILSTNGASNQWAFFTYTNVPTQNFTNVAIFTFFAPELSLPRVREADIDLYVTRGTDGTGTNLFLLDPAAVSVATKSLLRGGTELVLFTNAQPNEVFSIGVKSEDQQGAQFNIFAASSDKPFSSRDNSNNIVATAFPLPADIPDGTPDKPGGTNVFALVFEPDVKVQRVYVTNSIFHEQAGDLIGILNHRDAQDGGDASVVLNNHRTWNGLDTVVYDDSDQGDLGGPGSPPIIPPDGPGRLRDFVGQAAFGLWNLGISDNALFHTGSVQNLTLVIEPASTNGNLPVDIIRTVRAGGWVYAAFDVPADATNVHACVSYLSGTGPVELYLRRGDFPTRVDYDKGLTGINPPGDCLDLGLNDAPPLSQGRYYVGVFNAGPDLVKLHLIVEVQRALNPNRAQTIASDIDTFLLDDATTNSTIFVTNRGLVASVEVDVRIDHPRISDLALHLVNPQGRRILLAENRGRDTTNGYGGSASNVIITNFGARVLDDGFEFVDHGNSTIVVIGAGNIFSGWHIDSDNIDVSSPPSIATPTDSDTGTNIIDLNGSQGPGSISTNVVTTIGKTYLLSFAYSKNPDNARIPTASAEATINGSSVLRFAFNDPTFLPGLEWRTTSVVFQATSSVTKVGFSNVFPNALSSANDGGILLDTIRMDEVQLITNGTLYATFTDDGLKAFLPIKFAPPPFGDTNFVGVSRSVSDFERAVPGFYASNQTFDVWKVQTNAVIVSNANWLAYSETNFLVLRTGAVSCVVTTVPEKEYVLRFATRAAPELPLFFSGLGDFPGGLFFSEAAAVSRDGSVVVGSSSNAFGREAFRWEGGVKQALGVLPGRRRYLSVATGVSGNGQIVVGYGSSTPAPGSNNSDYEAFRWQTNVLSPLGFLAPYEYSAAQGISSDGLSIVGQAFHNVGGEAVVWKNGALSGLGRLPGDTDSLAFNVSQDGTVIVGRSTTASTSQACAWSNGVRIALRDLTGPPYHSQGYDTSADGNVTVGVGTFLGRADAIRWKGGQISGLGNANFTSVAKGVSGDGRVVVGYRTTASGSEAFIWDQARGMRNLQSELTNRFGFNLTGWRLTEATDISGDGTTIVGNGLNPSGQSEGWITRIGGLNSSSFAQIRLQGAYTNYFGARPERWTVQSVTFVARNTNTVLEFTGLQPGGMWLDDLQIRETGRKYYFPEEPLAPLIGQQAFGSWKLEVWDSRLGAAVGTTDLISWRLNLVYVRTNPPFAVLKNHLPITAIVPPQSLRYFAVDVTCDSAIVTNTLMSLNPPRALDLLFNQGTFPTGSEPGDYVLILNTVSNAIARAVGEVPLVSTGRYFLAVRNTNATPVDFLIRVDSDSCVKLGPLINAPKFDSTGFAFTWNAEPQDAYVIEYADDPAGPWIQIPQIITSDTGDFTFSDPSASVGGRKRFYRIVRVE